VLSGTTVNGDYGWALENNNGGAASIRHNNTNSQSGLTSATWSGHVIGVAYDADNATVQWYRDGVAVGTAQSIAAGSWCFAACVNDDTAVVTIVVNFGATSFAYAAPAGFTGIDSPVPASHGNAAISLEDLTASGSRMAAGAAAMAPLTAVGGYHGIAVSIVIVVLGQKNYP
jgi:hypothetical protein